MARFETFARDIRLATADLEPDVIARELAQFARASLSEVIASGEGSSRYERFVNGRPGAREESVTPPGPIFYEFSWWPEVIDFALDYLRRRSPVRSGRFRDSWFALANNAQIGSAADIPIGATVTLANAQPYARKIEVGAMTMSVPPGVVEDARVAVRRMYGALVDARKVFVTLGGGYALKRQGLRRGRARADAKPGSALRYPALVLTMR